MTLIVTKWSLEKGGGVMNVNNTTNWKAIRCCICGKPLSRYNCNRAYPVYTEDEKWCCRDCEEKYVIPVRCIIMQAKINKTNYWIRGIMWLPHYVKWGNPFLLTKNIPKVINHEMIVSVKWLRWKRYSVRKTISWVARLNCYSEI